MSIRMYWEGQAMRFIVRCLVVVVAGMLSLGMGAAQGETLQDAVKQMLETHPELKAMSYNRLAREKEIEQAKSGYYPTLDASGTLGRAWRRTEYESDWTRTDPRQATVSIRQNVYQFGMTKSEVERQKARDRSQAYLIQGASENLALQSTRVYLNVLKSIELNDLAKENLLNHERIRDQMKLRSRSGVDPAADLDQVMGRLALAQSNLTVTKANLNDAKTDYLALIGRMPGELVVPEAMNAITLTTVDEAEKLAVKQHPTLKSAKADLEAREKQYETAKGAMYPKLDLAADYIWSKDVYPYPYRVEDVQIAAILRFNLFNGMKDKNRKDETLLLISEAKEIMNNTERQTVQSIRLSWEAYKTAQERVDHLAEYVRAAGVTSEAFTKQWNIGRRTMFDVLDIQAESINAKSDFVKAKYEKLYTEYRVLSGMGHLVKALGLQWPAESYVEIAQEDAPQK
jgi:adhesin transport system outer membrane protein